MDYLCTSLGKKNTGGRNNLGRLTSYRKGGGHKQLYREINFQRSDLNGVITSIEYDPNRTCNIASVFDHNKRKFNYILAPKGISLGDYIKSGKNADVHLGHSLLLEKVPLGSFIHNISLSPNNVGKLARAAGSSAQLIHKNKKYATVKLKSGEHRLIPLDCHATLGILSNENNNILLYMVRPEEERLFCTRPRFQPKYIDPKKMWKNTSLTKQSLMNCHNFQNIA